MRGREHPNGGITRIALPFAVLISVAIISVQRGADRSGSTLEIAAQETAAPLANALRAPLSVVEGYFSDISARRMAFADNQQLKQEIATLREKQARYDNLAAKVARYESILGVDTETEIPLQKISARAVGETGGPFVRSLLLNVGSDDGVTIGNPVMSINGLVGHVINAGPNTTRVLRISDLNSRIAVASSQSNATAILAGDNSDNPKLSFINQPENWSLGDRVITSGDDGFLPRGLDVGKVIQGEAGELRVSLSSQSAPTDWVWVSPFKKLKPPPEVKSESEIGGAP
jgi:rod shape-determining protein MreC